MIEEISPKSRRTAALFAVFLGYFGIHRLYLGKTKSAIPMMAIGIAGFAILGTVLSVRTDYIATIAPGISVVSLFVIVGIWSLVDFIIILAGKMRDSEGKLLKNW